jgi:hypothetical protein
MGPETIIEYAGEGQQQFTRPTAADSILSCTVSRRCLATTSDDRKTENFVCAVVVVICTVRELMRLL